MSFIARMVARVQRPFMVYGYLDRSSRQFQKFTRIGSTVTILCPEKLSIANHVWVWHHSILDASEGLEINEGVQIGAFVGIFTHGSDSSIRLLGRSFVDIPHEERLGYTRGSVKIGRYSFIGTGSVVLPGVTIGEGCVIGPGTIVSKSIPNYSFAFGRPGHVVHGSTIDFDVQHFSRHDYSESYYNPSGLELIKSKLHALESAQHSVKNHGEC